LICNVVKYIKFKIATLIIEYWCPGVGEGQHDILDPIIDMLAFFAAMRNYSYVDVIGNALERTTVLEALGNAIRDFLATCVQATPEQRKKLEEEDKVRCPSISADELQKAIESFNKISYSLEEKGELIRFLRELYVRSLARAPKFKVQEAESRGERS